MMRAFSILLLALAVSAPATAPAAALKPWVALDGSLGRYSMGDVNRQLDALNLDLIGTSLYLSPIANGPGCGVSAGVDIGPGFSFGIGYDRLFASSGIADTARYTKLTLPANTVRGLVEYAFPRKGPVGAHIGAAAGRLMVTGQLVGDSVFQVRGTAPLFEVYLGGDWKAQPRCALFATVGYRYARVKEVKVNGRVELNPDGSKQRLDYGGPLARLGLRIPLTAPAGAAASTSGRGIKPWVGLNGSWGGYRIPDTDSLIERYDAALGEVGEQNHLGPKAIGGGFGFGGSLGLDFPGHLTLGVGYDRLTASSKASNADGSNEYQLPANVFRGFVEHRFQTLRHLGTRLGLAGGAVMEARSAARDSTSSDGRKLSFPIKGSGALLEAYGSAEWQATSRFTATASLGYRYAKVREVKVAEVVHHQVMGLTEEVTVGEVVYFHGNGSPYSLDYSGLIARIGLKVALTK